MTTKNVKVKATNKTKKEKNKGHFRNFFIVN